MINYIGSKLKLIDLLIPTFEAEFPGKSLSILELFFGSARLAYAIKASGHRVVMNDMNAAPHALAQGFVEADDVPWAGAAEDLITDLREAPPVDGWFTQTYARDARFFQPKNAVRIEGVRARIDELGLPPLLRAIGLASLLEASSRIDSNCGIQSAYLKNWSTRSHRDLDLRVPHLLPQPPAGRCLALRGDAQETATRLRRQGECFDIAYLDPPYNHHSYAANYHIWETLVSGEHPEVRGVARKPVDVLKSEFNAKNRCGEALRRVIEAAPARVIVVSFSDDGFLSRAEIEAMLAQRGDVKTVSRPHTRYVGRKNGRFNGEGIPVGEETAYDTVENVFVCLVRKAH
jgi:adenine-specific DNA-methyltransferase